MEPQIRAEGVKKETRQLYNVRVTRRWLATLNHAAAVSMEGVTSADIVRRGAYKEAWKIIRESKRARKIAGIHSPGENS